MRLEQKGKLFTFITKNPYEFKELISKVNLYENTYQYINGTRVRNSLEWSSNPVSGEVEIEFIDEYSKKVIDLIKSWFNIES